MSSGYLLLVFTSIVDTEVGPVAGATKGLAWVTKAVLPSGVIATANGFGPTGMSVGCLVLVFTSIVDIVSPLLLGTKRVLLSGVNPAPVGGKPSVMSSGCLVRVLTSIVESVPLV
jgi:hypothetical protein